MSLIERSFREKIVLVGLTVPPASEQDTERHLDELALLVDTAGADEAEESCSGGTIPIRRPSSAAERRRSCGTSRMPWTRTLSSSMTSSPRLSPATSRRFSGGPPSTARR